MHILSLPEGSRVDIRSLAEWFPEGRARIACALRELEARGYVERVRERLPSGQMVTRTYAFHAPALTRARREGEQETAAASTASAAQASPTMTAAPVPDLIASGGPLSDAVPDPVVAAYVAPDGGPVAEVESAGSPEQPAAESGPPRSEHRDQAEALLAGLRRTDIRLTLSGREVRRLAPLVVAWFENGLGRASVIHALTDGLPLHVRHPAGFLRNRLLDLLPPALPSLPGQARPSRSRAGPCPLHQPWRPAKAAATEASEHRSGERGAATAAPPGPAKLPRLRWTSQLSSEGSDPARRTLGLRRGVGKGAPVTGVA